MTEAQLRAAYVALGRGDVDALMQHAHPDCELEFPGTAFGGRHGPARTVRVFLKQNQRLFDGGLVFDVVWAHVVPGPSGPERGIVQWTNAGRTKTGVDYTNRGITVFHFKGGKIRLIQDYLDTETLAATWPQKPDSAAKPERA